MRVRRSALLVVLLFSAALSSRAQGPGIYALTGGTVHPASGPEIPNGTVVIRDGLIEAVGANIPIPADASVIELKGAHVYPGLIDAQTSLGFPAARPRRPAGGGGAAARPTTQQTTLPETSPAYIAIRNVNVTEEDVDARRGAGVTTILTAPAFGIFNGQSAIMNLGEGGNEARVIRTPAALQVSFTPRSAWTFPDSLMGVIAHIRQTFIDAQQYGTARSIYEKNPAGVRRPETVETLEALGPVLNRTIPVVFVADTELMMRRAAALAKEFNIRFILSGARQAYRMPADLKAWGVPVLVSVKWATAPTAAEDREEQPLRIIRDRQLQPTTPSVLVRSGVPFALVSGGGKTGDFIPGIRKAIENGLSSDDALRAVTLWPARIFGVERQLGSIERGKIANVVVSDKPIFEKQAKVTRVFIDGREMRLPPADKRAGETPASPIDGTWSLAIRTPEGESTISITLRSEEGKVTGTFSGSRGSGDVRNGAFDGSTIDFGITVKGQQESEAGEWVFRGTVSGNSMQGTVTTNLGTFQFSGSKPQ